MGAFFTNLQVFTNGRDVAAVRERIRAAFRADAAEHELDEVTDGHADRTVLMSTGAGERWISVYDQSTDQNNASMLTRVGQHLSHMTQAPVVAVLVHDSDVLQLWLYEGGQLIDEFNSRPEYFAAAPASEVTRLAGHPTRWTHLQTLGARQTWVVHGRPPMSLLKS